MTDVADLLKKIKAAPFADHAQWIGYLCIAWNWLDLEIDAILFALMGSDDESATAAVIYNMDQRDKIRAVLALGFIKKPSDDWYAELRSVVNEIDNNLRNERNRMVHDVWRFDGQDIFRLTKYAKVAHEQARKLAIIFGEGKPVSPADLSSLVIRILAAGGHLDELTERYRAAQQRPSPEIAG